MQSSSTKVYTQSLTLSDGTSIPQLGMGTWKITTQEALDTAIEGALESGYRHFDCAELYENQDLLGVSLKKGLEKLGLKREQVYLTSKIPPWRMVKEDALESIKESLQALGTEYLDLILIHWPTSIVGEPGEASRLDTWEAMVEAKKTGLVKSVGVSNFTKKHLESIYPKMTEKPVVNQIETHPLYQDVETIAFCQEKNIVITGYAPLACYDDKLMKTEVILKLSEKYSKLPHQVVLRWAVQRGFVVIPKSAQKEHLLSNAQFGDFQLAAEEIEQISALNIMFKTDWDPKDEI